MLRWCKMLLDCQLEASCTKKVAICAAKPLLNSIKGVCLQNRSHPDEKLDSRERVGRNFVRITGASIASEVSTLRRRAIISASTFCQSDCVDFFAMGVSRYDICNTKGCWSRRMPTQHQVVCGGVVLTCPSPIGFPGHIVKVYIRSSG